MHIMRWPISLNRVAGSPAPSRAKREAESSAVCAALRRKPRPFDKVKAGFLAKDARNGTPTFLMARAKRCKNFDINLLSLLVRRARVRVWPVPAPGLEQAHSAPARRLCQST